MRDTAILEEVGDFFERESLHKDAQRAFEVLISIDKNHGPAYQKLGMILSNDKNVGNDKEQAVEAYKRAIELIKGD